MSVKFLSAKPQVTPSREESIKGILSASPFIRGAFELNEASIPRDRSSPIGFVSAARKVRHKSPVPHATSRILPPGVGFSSSTVFLLHITSRPKVISRFIMSYRGAIRSNIVLTVNSFSDGSGRAPWIFSLLI